MEGLLLQLWWIISYRTKVMRLCFGMRITCRHFANPVTIEKLQRKMADGGKRGVRGVQIPKALRQKAGRRVTRENPQNSRVGVKGGAKCQTPHSKRNSGKQAGLKKPHKTGYFQAFFISLNQGIWKQKEGGNFGHSEGFNR